MATKKNTVKFKVLNPSGSTQLKSKNAPRLDTLNGKTICEVMHAANPGAVAFRGDETFAVIRELLKRRFPDAKIVPFTELPQGKPGLPFPFWMPIDEIAGVLKSKGCDAVLVGNGG